MKLYGHGWFETREEARRDLDFILTWGGVEVGLVESSQGWGYLYWAPEGGMSGIAHDLGRLSHPFVKLLREQAPAS